MSFFLWRDGEPSGNLQKCRLVKITPSEATLRGERVRLNGEHTDEHRRASKHANWHVIEHADEHANEHGD
ncbi:hypothetical protein K0T92_21005 [Paenibacillus oenotherae]|uniref:Uncharacterized protein n=1 Tax=Paenibacillus oenotherae TaxID=1435645 RepID=A0ABS7DB77_9BACL|nr:hypothetical protein [Paenibacillus oenotherae]MBW7477199.1 hypothetical protein [Paenibacillus oenotherae]